jgi:AcrR family transcriptional regulator
MSSSPRRADPPTRCFLREDDAPAKQKILTEALRLFVQDGLCETSIRDISAASGYTNPALFKHFPSKADLALHLFEQCYLSLFAAIDRAASVEGDFRARQRAVVTAYLELLDADRDALLYVQDNLRQFWPRMPERVRRSSIVALIHRLLERGRAAGEVTDAVPIALLVAGWMGVLQQFARLWFFGEFSGPALRHAAHLEVLLTRMTTIDERKR